MDIQNLISTVQLNCNISDARHAGNYTLCIYLLKMREFFRWEQQHAYSAQLSRDDIGNWITGREDLWEKLEDTSFQPINIAGLSFEPFDSDNINQPLKAEKLVYSGGYGIKDKPHFFLAQLESRETFKDFTITISNREYARDLTAPPAMSHNKNIFIRRESFKRMLWERTDEWRWSKPENAMARAIRCYDFDDDMEVALSAMTDNELNAAVLHEIGEIQAGEKLNGWHKMMADITFTQAEIMARAVRDHYADALKTLPNLIKKNNTASIHFYFANLTNMRKHIFPSLMKAYEDWCENSDIKLIEKIVADTHGHWQELAEQMLALHQKDTATCSDRIETLIKNSHI